MIYSMYCTRQVVFCLLTIALTNIAAQKCLSVPCGKLACGNVSCTTVSQDCSDGEEYLYPGLICECCGVCITRSIEKGGRCSTQVFISHITGCVSGLCCSADGICIEKMMSFGA